MLRSVDTCGGLTTNVTSECHALAFDVSLSTASTFVVPGAAGTVGCAVVNSPNQDATRSWPGSSRSTSSKTITLYLLSASRRAAITSPLGSAVRSTSSTTAPIRLVSLRTDSDMAGTSAVAWGVHKRQGLQHPRWWPRGGTGALQGEGGPGPGAGNGQRDARQIMLAMSMSSMQRLRLATKVAIVRNYVTPTAKVNNSDRYCCYYL